MYETEWIIPLKSLKKELNVQCRRKTYILYRGHSDVTVKLNMGTAGKDGISFTKSTAGGHTR